IHEDFEDERTRSRLNKEPAVSITITKQTTANVIDVTNEVKRIAGAFADSHGDKLHVSFTQDSSEQVNDVLSKLVRNAWIGFITVVIVLLVVLGFRNAILAAMGIPMSFLICFIFMFNMGESFNGSSLFALVLVLGIVVDDAIIIIENCYRHRQMGKSWKQAAIDGTEEVTSPVFSAIATTIAAFLPLMLMPGIMGKWLRIVPIVVSLPLAASLFEALFILPSHFAGWPGRGTAEPRPTPGWLVSLTDAYTGGLRFVMRFRYVFLGLIFVVFVGAIAMIPLLGVKMFQGEEINTLQIRVTMPVGTNLDTTAKTLEEFEKAIEKLPKSEIRAIHTTAGLVMTDSDWIFRTSVGQIWLDLVPVYERNRISDEIMADLRGRLVKISGPTDIEIAKINQGPPVGKPVEVKLKGKYFDQLESASKELEDYLTGFDGVIEIGNDFEPGKKEVRFHVDPELAAIHGLSVAQVGMAIRYAIDGVVADKIYDGDEEMDVVVRLDAGALERPTDLLRLPLLTPAGTNISLGDVAEYRLEYSRGQIRRYKGQRTITVFASLAADGPDAVEVNNGIEEEFAKTKRRYPSVTLDFSGEFQEFQNTFA
ncbi:efflux RND transporter permease subunit, partial [bacterium]|nr:efflux RND transporter permease subunit [bacterium]